MSYNYVFHTNAGSPARAVFSAGDTTGATLTVEFAPGGDFASVTLSKAVTTDASGQIVIDLTAADVDLVKDDVFRIVSVKGGNTRYIATGRAAYTAPLAGVGSSQVAGLSDTGYDIVLLMGQSNMQGGDGSISPAMDVTNPRVWAFPSTGSNANKVIQGSDPLGHLNPSTSGVGPGMSFANWYSGTIPGNRRVLLLPCASAGTGFTAGGGSARWNPTAEFSFNNVGNSLYELTIAQTKAALVAAPNSRVVGVLWAQGEADINLDPVVYRNYLESLIDGLRDRLSIPNLPFVIGSMVPEYAGGGAIDLVQRAVPTRKPYTAYVAGPTGHLYGADGLGVHYDAAGQREQGRRMVAGLASAIANVSPPNAVPASPPLAPANYTPPAGTANYTFDTVPSGWFTQGLSAPLTVSAGNLEIPVTTAYPAVASPEVVDLTAHAVTWKLTSLPPLAVGSSDIFLGICLDPANQQNAAGVTLTNSASPYTDVRVVVGNTRTVNGAVPAAASRAVGHYKCSSSAGNLVISWSPDGTAWTTLWTGAAPWPLTAVRPFLTAGHWNSADADSTVLVDALVIA